MGCSTSSQTSAIDTTRPSAKPEESNGASTTGAANENGNVADDCETIPEQAAAVDFAAAPPSEEEVQPAAVATPAVVATPDGAQSVDDSTPSEPAADLEQETSQAAVDQSEPKTEEAPAPSD